MTAPTEVIEHAFLDASSRDVGRQKRWVVLVDGNAEQLARVTAAARRHRVAVTIVLDLIHVLEYLWTAAYVFYPEASPQAEAWGDRASALAVVRRRRPGHRLDSTSNVIRRTCAYDTHLAAGLPIATGVIEGACRYLVRDRMEITGARWSLEGAEAILRLRSLRASGDWEAYWRHHEQREQQRQHASRYADATIPPLTAPAGAAPRKVKTPHLRVVK